ncbi:hypothetical protein BT63DRAFT_457007 [Microthyrium microscopicum]|uniref:Uncharacterized protein n=1 Tax=Microthyrium microscopicum TaxID=703497 RepID=A0A6A6U7U4_9PEZI|nr:hypothetical protein BT63DRAFT_457007 [Microthyrium microscopicum]
MFAFQLILAALPLLAFASPLDNTILADGPIKACSINGGEYNTGTTGCCRSDNQRRMEGNWIACQTGRDTDRFDQCCRDKNREAGPTEMKLSLTLALMSAMSLFALVSADCSEMPAGINHREGDHICGDGRFPQTHQNQIYVCSTNSQWLLAADCGSCRCQMVNGNDPHCIC